MNCSQKFILGIESSCDDTGIALVDLQTTKLVGEKRISSAQTQANYGGIVPEVAARYHFHVIIDLTLDLLNSLHVNLSQITAIAFTKKPGLKSCLMVGELFARTLAFVFKKPLLPVDHVYAHIFSIGLENQVKFPFLALVASGKTTAIFLVRSLMKIELLNKTVDDAIGEAYDKVGRMMGLQYPAGPLIDHLAINETNPFNLAQQPMASKSFSYSGIKTASKNYWQKLQADDISLDCAKKLVSTAFQKWVLRSLERKINYYSSNFNVHNVAIVGGVAANQGLKQTIKKMKQNFWLINTKYATDNGAMVAYYGCLLFHHEFDKQNL